MWWTVANDRARLSRGWVRSTEATHHWTEVRPHGSDLASINSLNEARSADMQCARFAWRVYLSEPADEVHTTCSGATGYGYVGSQVGDSISFELNETSRVHVSMAMLCSYQHTGEAVVRLVRLRPTDHPTPPF